MGSAAIDTCFLINWARFSRREELELVFDRLFMPEPTFSEVKSDVALSLASEWLSRRFLVLVPVMPTDEREIEAVLKFVADHPELPSIDPPELYAFLLAKRLSIPLRTDNKAPKRISLASEDFSSVLVLDSLDVLKLIAEKGHDIAELVERFMEDTGFKFSRKRLVELGLLPGSSQRKKRSLEELLEEWRREDEEAREIRRREADWAFIESQPPRLRAALRLYVELGDLHLAARIAGMTVDEFNELRLRARIPVVL